jgi:hypothetical protein
MTKNSRIKIIKIINISTHGETRRREINILYYTLVCINMFTKREMPDGHHELIILNIDDEQDSQPSRPENRHRISRNPKFDPTRPRENNEWFHHGVSYNGLSTDV